VKPTQLRSTRVAITTRFFFFLLTTIAAIAQEPPLNIHESPRIRTQVAESEDLPEKLYLQLVEHYFEETKLTLSQNTGLPVSVYKSLAEDPSSDIQRNLIGNAGFPEETRLLLIEKYAQERPPVEREWLLRHRNAPIWLLEDCVENIDPNVRRFIASHPRSTEKLLEILSSDISGMVASTARDALKRKFPSAYHRLSRDWTHLDDLPIALNLERSFARAARQSDSKTLLKFIDHYKKRELPLRKLSQALFPDLLEREFDPIAVDLLIQQGLEPSTLSRYAGQCGFRPRWLAHFKKLGVLEGHGAYQAFDSSLETDNTIIHMSALLKAGISPANIDPKDWRRSILFKTVISGDLTAIQLLVEYGIDPLNAGNDYPSPLDAAVMLKFIDAIKILDVKSEHGELLKQFGDKFPPNPKSHFVGRWKNLRDGFDGFEIYLEPSGSGRMIATVRVMPLGWRSTSTDSAELFGLIGENLSGAPIFGRVEKGQSKDQIFLIRESGESEILIRSLF
jgi:hypothetical protein